MRLGTGRGSSIGVQQHIASSVPFLQLGWSQDGHSLQEAARHLQASAGAQGGPRAGGEGVCRQPAQCVAELDSVLEGGSQALPLGKGPGVGERSGGWCAEPGWVLPNSYYVSPPVGVPWPQGLWAHLAPGVDTSLLCHSCCAPVRERPLLAGDKTKLKVRAWVPLTGIGVGATGPAG